MSHLHVMSVILASLVAIRRSIWRKVLKGPWSVLTRTTSEIKYLRFRYQFRNFRRRLSRRSESKGCILVIAELNLYGGARTYLQGLLEYLSNKAETIILALKTTAVGIEGVLPLSHARQQFVLPEDHSEHGLSAAKWLHGKLRSKCPESVFVSAATPGWGLEFLWLGQHAYYVLHTSPLGPLSKVRGDILRSALRYATTVVAVSESSKKEIVTKFSGAGLSDRNVSVVPGGVTISALRKRHFVPTILTVLTMGHVIDYKNPFMWIEVARQ